jgi:hypothetical protein
LEGQFVYVFKHAREIVWSGNSKRFQSLSDTEPKAKAEKEPKRVSDLSSAEAPHKWTVNEVAERIDAAFAALSEPKRWDDWRSPHDHWYKPRGAPYRRALASVEASRRCQLSRHDRRKQAVAVGLGIRAHEFRPAEDIIAVALPITITQTTAQTVAKLWDGADTQTVKSGRRATWVVNRDELRRLRGSFRKKSKTSPSSFTELANRDESTSIRTVPLNSKLRAHEALGWLMAAPADELRQTAIAFGRSGLSVEEFCSRRLLAGRDIWPEGLERRRRIVFQRIADKLNKDG